jgi:Asp-tRNA(Asn)/Glu-tRNA(Gln) amidotransferase A subunit family amidase
LSVDLGYYEVHPKIGANTRAAIRTLEELGIGVEEVELGWDRTVNDAWAVNWSVGLATLFGDDIDRIGSLADPELVSLIEQGRAVSGIELKQVDVTRTWQWARLRKVFETFDFLVCPTLAVPVPPAEHTEDSDFGATTPEGRFAGFEMTSPFSLVPQCPVISVPSGFDDEGMPTGLQIVGHRFDDVGVLGLATAYERVRPWSESKPPCLVP